MSFFILLTAVFLRYLLRIFTLSLTQLKNIKEKVLFNYVSKLLGKNLCYFRKCSAILISVRPLFHQINVSTLKLRINFVCHHIAKFLVTDLTVEEFKKNIHKSSLTNLHKPVTVPQHLSECLLFLPNFVRDIHFKMQFIYDKC